VAEVAVAEAGRRQCTALQRHDALTLRPVLLRLLRRSAPHAAARALRRAQRPPCAASRPQWPQNRAARDRSALRGVLRRHPRRDTALPRHQRVFPPRTARAAAAVLAARALLRVLLRQRHAKRGRLLPVRRRLAAAAPASAPPSARRRLRRGRSRNLRSWRLRRAPNQEATLPKKVQGLSPQRRAGRRWRAQPGKNPPGRRRRIYQRQQAAAHRAQRGRDARGASRRPAFRGPEHSNAAHAAPARLSEA